MRDKKGRFVRGSIPWSKNHKHSPKSLKKMSKTWFKKEHKFPKEIEKRRLENVHRVILKRNVENNPMKNPKSRKKKSATLKKLFKEGKWSSPMKGKIHTEKTRNKIKKARKLQKSFPRNLTKPEINFMEICKQHNLPFKYTGDGSFWIENLNPDFVECNGRKMAIEVFGRVFHDPKKTFLKNIRYSQTEQGRREILAKYGWKLIVIWDDDNEQIILNKVEGLK